MADTEGLDVVDVESMDGVRQHMYVDFQRLRDEEGHFWEEWRKPPMTKAQRQKMEELLGDGMASVTVGTDVKASVDFGNGAGCSVYVKLTCNQDADSIMAAHAMAEEYAVQFMDEGHVKACRILNNARGLPNPGDLENLAPEERLTTKARAGAPSKAKSPNVVEPKPESVVASGPAPKPKKKKVTVGSSLTKKKGPVTAKTKGPAKKPGPKPKTKGTKKPNFRRG